MKIHQLVKDPSGINHRWVPDFELAFFDEQKYALVQSLMQDWWWLSLLYALFYIIAVFIGRSWMAKKNEKFELRQSLIIWNTLLTIFSLWGVCRCVPEIVNALTQHGFRYSVCDSTYMEGITGLW